MKRTREIIIQKSEEGRVLSQWLSERYTYHTLEKWIEYINKGMVKINSREITPETELKANDKVVYYPEPIVEPWVDRNYKVIYEDEDLLVINKPSDLPCHPGGIYFENTLWYILKEKYDYISLVNRLDRETSGIMLIAKNKASAKYYFNLMMDRNIKKEYLVLVHGTPENKLPGKGWLIPARNSKIIKKRDFLPDENACQPLGEGDKEKQFSHTEFKLLKTSENLSLIKCILHTGRTHQIRATINSLGYPVVGDKIYGLNDKYFFMFINDQLTKKDWEKLLLKNQALHSWKTTLQLLDGREITFTADPPEAWPIRDIS